MVPRFLILALTIDDCKSFCRYIDAWTREDTPTDVSCTAALNSKYLCAALINCASTKSESRALVPGWMLTLISRSFNVSALIARIREFGSKLRRKRIVLASVIVPWNFPWSLMKPPASTARTQSSKMAPKSQIILWVDFAASWSSWAWQNVLYCCGYFDFQTVCISLWWFDADIAQDALSELTRIPVTVVATPSFK